MKSESKLLLVLLGVLVLAVVYFFPVRGLMDENDALEIEKQSLTVQINQLLPLVADEEKFKAEIQDYKDKTNELIAPFPSFIRTEDEVMELVGLEDELETKFSTISVGEAAAVLKEGEEQEAEAPAESGETEGEPAGETEGEGTAEGTAEETANLPEIEKKKLQLFELPIDVAFTAGYTNFKELVEILALTKESKNLESVSVSYDDATGELAGTLNYKSYFISGSDKPYEETEITDIKHGTENFFGTIDLPKKKENKTDKKTPKKSSKKKFKKSSKKQSNTQSIRPLKKKAKRQPKRQPKRTRNNNTKRPKR